MKVIVSLLLPIFALLASCNLNQASNSEEEYVLKKLHNEVMDVHDGVMPRMSEIGRLKRKLKDYLNEDEPHVKTDSIQQLIYQLDEADEAMMNWMGEFKKPDYSNFDAAKSMYEQEKVKIANVQDKMISTIDKVQSFLTRLWSNTLDLYS